MTTQPDQLDGHFGKYGGRFVPEALIGALNELEDAHTSSQKDPVFKAELAQLHRTYTGRPSIITEVPFSCLPYILKPISAAKLSAFLPLRG